MSNDRCGSPLIGVERDQIARNLGISANNDFAMLKRIGGECAGEISLWPDELASEPGFGANVRWLDDGEAA